jgi:hypothetical protein
MNSSITLDDYTDIHITDGPIQPHWLLEFREGDGHFT